MSLSVLTANPDPGPWGWGLVVSRLALGFTRNAISAESLRKLAQPGPSGCVLCAAGCTRKLEGMCIQHPLLKKNCVADTAMGEPERRTGPNCVGRSERQNRSDILTSKTNGLRVFADSSSFDGPKSLQAKLREAAPPEVETNDVLEHTSA